MGAVKFGLVSGAVTFLLSYGMFGDAQRAWVSGGVGMVAGFLLALAVKSNL